MARIPVCDVFPRGLESRIAPTTVGHPQGVPLQKGTICGDL